MSTEREDFEAWRASRSSALRNPTDWEAWQARAAMSIASEQGLLHRLDMEKSAAWQQGYAQGLSRAAAVPQPAPEPVAVVGTQSGGAYCGVQTEDSMHWATIKASTAAMMLAPLPIGTLLYATPPAPKAQTLTDDQINRIATAHGSGGWQSMGDMRLFARAVLAAAQGGGSREPHRPDRAHV